LPLAAGYWISWKHGLIRADDHVNLFFGFALLGFVAFPSFAAPPVSTAPATKAISGIGALLCLGGIFLQNPTFLRDAPLHTVQNLFATARDLLFVNRYESTMGEQLLRQKQRFDCPNIKSEIGAATVDVFGQYQGIAILNDLNYHARPVFESACAITPFLMRTNAEFYRSEDAPQYVISLFDTIDDRLATQDDADALRVLLLDYDPILTENEWVLWRRRVFRKNERDELKLVETREAAVGQEIPIPGNNIWCAIDLRETTLGSLRKALYKLPNVLMIVTDAEGNRTIHRLLIPAARTGFIADPYIVSQNDLVGLKSDVVPPPKHVVSIRLLEDSARNYFADRLSIRFYRIDGF
jgi:hypothetical protein